MATRTGRIPPPLELDPSSRRQSEDELDLLAKLDALEAEATTAKERWVKPEDTDMDLALYRGEYGPKARDPFFDCNFTKAFINRMAAQETESRPIIRVEPRKEGLKPMAVVAEQCMDAVWDEAEMQRQTYKLVHTAAVTRSAGFYVGYDPATDDIYLEMIRLDQVGIDPGVYEAALVKEAEYSYIKRIRPTAELRRRFPLRGPMVDADANIADGAKEVSNRSVNGSVTDLARGMGARASGDALGRANTWEWFLRDRQTDGGGNPLFPGGRMIFRSRDRILWDGPNPYWDGLNALDWYDWEVDPMHPWGFSEARNLMRLQASFNQLGDGLVENQILTNFILATYTPDAVDAKTLQQLRNVGSTLLLAVRNRNALFNVQPPIAFGADKIALMRAIFTFAQLQTGVTDVTLGENPGSLQSGAAIEGLQEGASLMNRSRASRLEDMYKRVGSKLLARLFQFWPSDKVTSLVGKTPEALEYVKLRSEFFLDEQGKQVTPSQRQDALKYLRFHIIPGSSLPGSRVQRAKMMSEFLKMGVATGEDVLEAAQIPNAKKMAERAKAEAADRAKAQSQAKAQEEIQKAQAKAMANAQVGGG